MCKLIILVFSNKIYGERLVVILVMLIDRIFLLMKIVEKWYVF